MQVTFYPCTLYQIESSHKNEFSDFLTDLYDIIKICTTKSDYYAWLGTNTN